MTIKGLFQTFTLLLLVGIISQIETDFLLSYILPVSLVGIVLLLLFFIYYIKHLPKGLLFLLLVLTLTVPEKIHAQGVYNPPEISATDIAGEVLEGIQNATVGGNIWTSEYDDKEALEKDRQKIISYQSEVCNIDENSYDPRVLAKAHFIMNSFHKMSKRDVNGEDSYLFGLWSGESGDQIREAYSCAEDYVENAARIQKEEASKCDSVALIVKKSNESCWPCKTTYIVIESIQRFSSLLYEIINDFALNLLGTMFLLWIAFKTLYFLGTFGFTRISEYFTEFLIRTIVVCFCAVILHAPIGDFLKMTVSPFISYVAGLSIEFSKLSITGDFTTTDEDGNKTTTKQTFAEQAEEKLNLDITCSYCQNMNDKDATLPHTSDTTNYFLDDQTVNAILCLVCTVYQQVVPFTAIGDSLSCYSIAMGHTIPFISLTLPKIPYLFLGWTFIILFSIFMVFVAFYVMDAFIKLGFVLFLTPLLVTAFAFPISREYTQRGWNLLVHAVLQILGLSIATALIITLFINLLPGDGVSALIEAMVENSPEDLYETITGDSVLGYWITFVLIIAAAGFGFVILPITATLVETLSGVTTGIPGVGTAALGSMIKTGVGIAATTTSLTKKVAGSTVDSVKKTKAFKYFEKEGEKEAQAAEKQVEATARKISNDSAKAVEKTGKAAENATKQAGKAVAKTTEQSGKAVASGVDTGGTAAGKGMMTAGKGMMTAGAKMSSTVFGAVIGIPMMIAGAAVTLAGAATMAAAKAAAAIIRIAAKIAATTVNLFTQMAAAMIKLTTKTASKTVRMTGGALERGAKRIVRNTIMSKARLKGGIAGTRSLVRHRKRSMVKKIRRLKGTAKDKYS